MYQNIVLHIPHNSVFIPEQLENLNSKAIATIRSNSFYLVDNHALPLFLPTAAHPRIHSIVAPYTRMLVDMERMPDDPLESKGFGIVSQWAIDALGENFRQQALAWYQQYHHITATKLNALVSPLLIDCHSFSSHPTPLCPCPPDIDICIGWNEDDTAPAPPLLDRIVSYFIDCGYSVGINNPFSNSKTFPEAKAYHSLMIEINKRCYMDEQTLNCSSNFAHLHDRLQWLYSVIMNYNSAPSCR